MAMLHESAANPKYCSANVLLGAMLIGGLSSGASLAQTTQQQIDPSIVQAAQAKMLAKQQADYPRLAAENERLKREVESLRAELTQLKREFDDLSKKWSEEAARKQMEIAAVVDAAKPESTFVSRASAGEIFSMSDETAAANRMSRSAVTDRGVKLAEKVDSQIAAYAAQKKPKGEITKAMYEGKAVVGMPKDALEVFGKLKVRAEQSTLISYEFLPLGVETTSHRDAEGTMHFSNPTPYLVSVEKGIVVSVVYPR